MENKKQQEIKVELTPEAAKGNYCNLAMIAHSGSEFFLDFIAVAPNMPQARVQSRIIMTPENAKNLFMALRDNLQRYEKTFGEIRPKMPLNQGGNNNEGGIPNPFIMGGNA